MRRIGSALLLWSYLWVYTLGPLLHQHPEPVAETAFLDECPAAAVDPLACRSGCAPASPEPEPDARETCSLCRIMLLPHAPALSVVQPVRGALCLAYEAVARDFCLYLSFAGFTFGARAPPPPAMV